MTYRLFYVSNYLMDKYNKDIIAINDVGVKSPNYDAYGLFRALHSHNPPNYSHIVGLSSHFYAHIGAGPKVFHPLMSKLMWD